MAGQKSTYHHGNLRQAMLDAASAILADEGLQALTLRACARKAGVSHAAPAHHFGGLKGLLTAVVAQSFDMIAAVAEKAYQTAPKTPESQISEFARQYAKFAVHNPERFRLMFRRDLVDIHDPVLEQAERRAYAIFTRMVYLVRGEPARDFEEFRAGKLPKSVYQDVLLIWSTVHGFTHLFIEQQLTGYDEILGSDADKFIDEVWDDLAGPMLAGLSTRFKPRS